MEQNVEEKMMRKKAFVTVGTTKFDELIKAVDSFEFGRALVESGYYELVVQCGNTGLTFKELLAVDKGDSLQDVDSRLSVEAFDFLPSIKQHMETASLIICHAGAGSIFEGLRAGKNLMVVPNSALMDNHQVELAHHLEKLGYLVSTSPTRLAEDVLALKTVPPRQPYIQGGPEDMIKRINEVVFMK